MTSKSPYMIKEDSFEIPDERMRPNDEQILVKLKLSGLCNLELNHQIGISQEDRKEHPMKLGHKWVGHVVKVGKNVKGFEPGDVVTGHWQGTCGEYYLTTPRCCFKVNSATISQNY